MIHKLIPCVIGVLSALVVLGLAASPASPGMGYTVSTSVPLLLRWVPGGEFPTGDLAGVGREDERPVLTVEIPGF